MAYLEQVEETKAFRFRRGIPAHLRPYFPDRGTVWREPLGKDAEQARFLCLEVSAKVERLFQQAQAQYDADQQGLEAEQVALTMEQVTALAADWKRGELSRRAQFMLVRPIPPGWSEFLLECRVVGVAGQKPKGEEPEEFMARMGEEEAFLDRAVSDLTRRHGLFIGQDHPVYAIMYKLLRANWIDVLETEHRWRAGEFTALPTGDIGAIQFPVQAAAAAAAPRQSSLSTSEGTSSSKPLFRAAFEDWQRLGRPAVRTVIEAKTAIRLFEEFHGDLPIDQIGKSHARTFRDALARLPTHLTAAQKAKPLPVLLAENLSGERRLPQTVNKTLNLLGAVLSRAEKEGHFDGQLWSNPFAVHLDVEDDDEDSYEPFDDSEIEMLFASPIFALGERPKQGRGDTAYWAPLLSLFHGTRRQDILQLFVRDIRKDSETGLYLIDVNRDDGKKVKNADSVRRIPLHARVIELGFLEWVEARRKAVGSDGSLWPGLEDRRKLFGRIDRWAKWFHGYLATYVVDHPRKKTHSFRGTFKRVGKRCDVNPIILDRICGHSIGSVGGKYGRRKLDSGNRDSGYPLETLSAAINRVRYPGDEQLKKVGQ